MSTYVVGLSAGTPQQQSPLLKTGMEVSGNCTIVRILCDYRLDQNRGTFNRASAQATFCMYDVTAASIAPCALRLITVSTKSLSILNHALDARTYDGCLQVTAIRAFLKKLQALSPE